MKFLHKNILSFVVLIFIVVSNLSAQCNLNPLTSIRFRNFNPESLTVVVSKSSNSSNCNISDVIAVTSSVPNWLSVTAGGVFVTKIFTVHPTEDNLTGANRIATVTFSLNGNTTTLQVIQGTGISERDKNKERSINHTISESYDINGKVISSNKSYFNELGRLTQTQSLDVKTNKVWASEVKYDEQGRTALATSTAPIDRSDFHYQTQFVKKENGETFTKADIGRISVNGNLLEPSVVGSQPGSLGAYTSNANTGNLYQDTTNRPYTRTFYDELNPGKTLKVIGGNKINGEYPQGFTHTMQAAQELNYVFGEKNFNISEKEALLQMGLFSQYTLANDNVFTSMETSYNVIEISPLNCERVGSVFRITVASDVLLEDGEIYFLKTEEERFLQIIQRLNFVDRDKDITTRVFNEPIDCRSLFSNQNYTLANDNVFTSKETSYDAIEVSPLNCARVGNSLRITVASDVILEEAKIYYLNTEENRFLQIMQKLDFVDRDRDITTRVYNEPIDCRFLPLINSTRETAELIGRASSIYSSNLEVLNPKIQKTVAIDPHGEEVVSFAYDDGRVLATARSGEGPKKKVMSLIDKQGYTDIHIPKGCENSVVFIGGSANYKVFDLKTSKKLSNISNLTAGVYRIEAINKENLSNLTYIENGEIKPISSKAQGVTYDINYYDYSLNYYDDAGNLTSSLQPLGFDNEAYNAYNLTGEVTHIDENLKSYFKFNSLGQLLETENPDEGKAWFEYRSDGQIRFSKNSKQKIAGEFSYTHYDNRARPVESGVYKENNGLTFETLPAATNIVDQVNTYEQYISDEDYLKNNFCKEQHFTRYDTPDPEGLDRAFEGAPPAYKYQSFVAGNVSCTHTKNPETTTTWYSYDIYGRVTWIVQKINGIEGPITIDYEYDDVTGAVNKVYYAKGTSGQFIHRYTYDKDDYSLIRVETSEDDTNFKVHADYEYYETGELKRTVLAEGLQGIDYVYNLNGALKAINHPSLDSSKDPGGDDGSIGKAQPDAFGMHIDYYKGDYQRDGVHITTSNAGQDQYNGNIKAVRWNNAAIEQDDLQAENTYAYTYDRNNWLKSAEYGTNRVGDTDVENQDFATVVSSGSSMEVHATNTITLGVGTHFEEGSTVDCSIVGFQQHNNSDYTVSNLDYDANGNIQSLKRNKNTDATGSNEMDNLHYVYKRDKPNQLLRVEDASGAVAGAEDIDTQVGSNYVYNSIGQLVKNNAEDIAYIYNASGLVSEVKKGANPVVKFFYNDKNHRVRKESYNPDTGELTATQYYVRDVAGTPMAIYNQTANGQLTLVEHTVYGANRLGVYKRATAKTTYELTDHLGNVRALVEEGDAEIKGTDYYPFGMPMPDRNSLAGGELYRYAFQGQEKDSETGKEAFELRLWDARIGRWLTTDPAGEFHSPYLGMGNNPISKIDSDGGKTDDIYRKQADGTFKNVGKSDNLIIQDENGKEISSLKSTWGGLGLALNDEYFEARNILADSGVLSAHDAKFVSQSRAFEAGGNVLKSFADGIMLIEGIGALKNLKFSSIKNGWGAFKGLFTKTAVNASDDFVKLLTPIDEFDASRTLYRGFTGTENTSVSIFFTDDATVAATYVKNGLSVHSIQVSEFALLKLEQTGKLLRGIGKHSKTGITSNEFEFIGRDLINSILKISQ